MTVQELIWALRDMPPEAEVFTEEHGRRYCVGDAEYSDDQQVILVEE